MVGIVTFSHLKNKGFCLPYLLFGKVRCLPSLPFFFLLLEKQSQFFPPQVVRFVAALSKLKAKGRDWKSTLLSEVSAFKTTSLKKSDFLTVFETFLLREVGAFIITNSLHIIMTNNMIITT